MSGCDDETLSVASVHRGREREKQRKRGIAHKQTASHLRIELGRNSGTRSAKAVASLLIAPSGALSTGTMYGATAT